MKKVLLIKLEAPSYSSIGMENAFKEHFEEVHSIDWQRINFNTGGKGLWPEIYTKCLEVMPDLIFCQFQKPVLTTEQFKRLAKFGFVINYTEDVREDTTWYEEVAPHIGLTLFTNMDDVEKLSAKGINNVGYMMVSYNDVWYKPQPKTEKYYGDIIFIGNNYVGSNLNFPQAQERQDMIKFMKGKFGDKFQAYGMGQENQMLNPAQCVEAYNNCSIVVTHNNFNRLGYMSDRGLCAMGCGGVTIHKYFDGLEEMLYEALYYSYWKDFDQLEEKCILLLKENFKRTDAVKQSISDYTKENHSWRNRCKFIKAAIILMNKKVTVHEFD